MKDQDSNLSSRSRDVNNLPSVFVNDGPVPQWLNKVKSNPELAVHTTLGRRGSGYRSDSQLNRPSPRVIPFQSEEAA